jgi:hypothetical protein
LLNPSAENPDLPAAQRARKTGPIIRIECASRNLLIGPVHKRFSAEKEEGFRTRNLVKSRNPNAFRIKKRTVGIHGYGFATPNAKNPKPLSNSPLSERL